MGQLFKNNARATLGTTLLAVTGVGGTFDVATSKGALFPAPGGGEYFDVTLQDATNLEIIRCSARSGDTLTIQERAREGTTAHDFAIGTVVALRLTAGAIADTLAHPAVATGAHAATSISYGGSATISATDVEGALDELDIEKATPAQITAAVAAHEALPDPHPLYVLTANLTPALAGKQNIDAFLTSLALLGTAANKLLYTTGVDTAAEFAFTAAAQLLLSDMKFSGVYGEKVSAVGNLTGASGIDTSAGTYMTATLTGAADFTTGTGFTNPMPSGYMSGFMLELTNGGAYTITWPASVKWAAGVQPTLTAAGVDILMFTTSDAGTTWRGGLTQKDSK